MHSRRSAMFGGVVALSSFFALGAGAARAATPSASPAGRPLAEIVNTSQATVRSTTAQVGAKTEAILVNAKGLPLYYYQADTARKSQVGGVLARLWPALVSAKPTAVGIKGKVVSLKQTDGSQVTYNGHFLYTFVDDSPGHVTGQGVSNFFVATPNIGVLRGATTVKTVPSPVTPSRGYGY
jgi:predicted lipoprotein with Yx(FWY)xxD motif